MRRMKACFSLAICLFLIFTVACQTPVPSEETDLNETLTGLIGQEQGSVAETLSSLDIQMEETQQEGEYLLSNPVPYLGSEFSVYLLFERETKQLYGFRYVADYEKAEMESAIQSIESIYDQLGNIYGETSTYPGLGNRFSDATDIESDLSKNGSLTESWDLENHEDYVLNATVSDMDDAHIQLKLTYQIQKIPAVA